MDEPTYLKASNLRQEIQHLQYNISYLKDGNTTINLGGKNLATDLDQRLNPLILKLLEDELVNLQEQFKEL